MFAIKIIDTNMDIIVALNDGVQPQLELNEFGGINPTYLVVTPGEPNCIVGHNELMAMVGARGGRKTTRQFYYIP